MKLFPSGHRHSGTTSPQVPALMKIILYLQVDPRRLSFIFVHWEVLEIYGKKIQINCNLRATIEFLSDLYLYLNWKFKLQIKILYLHDSNKENVANKNKAFHKIQSSCITILCIISNLRSGVNETPSGQVHFSGIVPAPQGFLAPFTHSPNNAWTSRQIKLLFVFGYNIYIYIVNYHLLHVSCYMTNISETM